MGRAASPNTRKAAGKNAGPSRVRIEDRLNGLAKAHSEAAQNLKSLDRALCMATQGSGSQLLDALRDLKQQAVVWVETDHFRWIVRLARQNRIALWGEFHENLHAAALGARSHFWDSLREADWTVKNVAEIRCLLKSVARPDLIALLDQLRTEHSDAATHARARDLNAVEPANDPAPPEAENVARRRAARKLRDARDRYIYREFVKFTPYKRILSHVNRQNDWPQLSNFPSLIRAAKSYAKRKRLEPPPRRKGRAPRGRRVRRPRH